MIIKRLIATLTIVLLLAAAMPGLADDAERIGNFYTAGLPILAEPETFEVVVGYDSYCLIDWNEKTFHQKLAETTNVNLHFTVLNDWTTQTNLMLASGDLPDVFLGEVAIDDNIDYFHDLTELIDLYAPTLNEALSTDVSVLAGMRSTDGTIRGLTNYSFSVGGQMGTVYWINQNWLDALNLSMPTTVDELYNVLVAFRDGDPNGNGQNDEIPLSFCQLQWAGKVSNLFGLFGVLYSTSTYVQADDDHNVIFQPAQEEFYDALVWLNKLQSEGLLDGEGFSQTDDQYAAKIAQNVLGICGRYDPQNFLEGFVPLSAITNGDVKTLIDGNGSPSGNRNIAITVKCETPETLVRYYELINSDYELKMSNRYGEKGVYWDFAEDGYNIVLQDYDSAPIEGYEFWDQYVYTIGYMPPFSFFGTADMARDHSKKTIREQAVAEYQQYFPTNPYASAAISEELNTELNLLYVEVDAYVQNFVAMSILDGVDEEKWNSHLSTLEALGVDRYVELRQMGYDNYLASIQ